MNELEGSLKKQIKLSVWHLIVLFFAIVAAIVHSILAISDWDNFNYNTGESSTSVGTWIALILTIILFIAAGVFWILGIVNAVKINKLVNGEAVLLIVFSVITFMFVNLIMAIVTKNTFSGRTGTVGNSTNTRNVGRNNYSSSDSEAENLRQAFMSGVITSKEYEAKKVALKKKRIAELDKEM